MENVKEVNNGLEFSPETTIKDMLISEVIVVTNSPEFKDKIHEAAEKLAGDFLADIVSKMEPQNHLVGSTTIPYRPDSFGVGTALLRNMNDQCSTTPCHDYTHVYNKAEGVGDVSPTVKISN